MLSTRDDPALVQLAIKRGFVLEDEVREGRYTQSQSPGMSIISVLRAKGYLQDNDYLELFKIHVEHELRRGVKSLLHPTVEGFASRVADMFSKARSEFTKQARFSKPEQGGKKTSEMVLVCPNCATKYDTSKLAPRAQYRCRKCGNVLVAPDEGLGLVPEMEADLEEVVDVEDLVGEVVGGCRILERIGMGGMGVVYLGRHMTLERDVAIKVLARRRASDFFRKQFLAESRAAAKLTHPNVVQVFDAGEVHGSPYIVMEYVEGATVKQLINTRKRLSLDFIKRVIHEAAEGLGAAHRLKLAHCDVKPENLMISFTGNTKVMDFGLARVVGMQADAGRPGMLIGTPFYMAPEQFDTDAEVDHRTDIYALGVTLYHMLTGNLPFTGDSPYQIMSAHQNEKYTPVREIDPGIPEELGTIMGKMLMKDKKERYQSMYDVIKDIERVKLPSEAPQS